MDYLLEFHERETDRLEKLFNKISMNYSVVRVLGKEIIVNSGHESVDAFLDMQNKEYNDKIEFDCCLMVYKSSAENLIKLLQTFNDIVKADLTTDHYNKLVADTLLVTKGHAQKES